jgi:histidyl-tRNA synthetase
MSYRGNMKKRLGRANSVGARYAIVAGDDELDRGEVQLKNLESGEQSAVAIDKLVETLKR